jgi:hypothetical protein
MPMTEIHCYNTEIMKEYGWPEAVIIQHFIHWVNVNKRLNRNFHDGRTWTYQTLEEIAAYFGYLSRDQVNRALRTLVKNKVLRKGNYNKAKFDRTVWYAFEDEERFLALRLKSPTAVAESPDGKGGIATPIPDPKTISLNKEEDIGASAPRQQSSEKIEIRENVCLTRKQRDELLTAHGVETYEKMIDKLSVYKSSTGKIYKSDYLAIKRWVVDWLSAEKSQAIATEKTLAENKRFYQTIIEIMERKNMRGLPRIVGSEVIDEVIGRKISLKNVTFRETFAAWYGITPEMLQIHQKMAISRL